MASGGMDGVLRLRDARTGNVRFALGPRQDWIKDAKPTETTSGKLCRIRSIAFSSDGKSIASGDFDGEILVWDRETQEPASIDLDIETEEETTEEPAATPP